MSQALHNYLEALPDIVSPEQLAEIIGTQKATVYQRLWRLKHGQAGENALPKFLNIPGTNRIGFLKADVAAWFIAAQETPRAKNRNLKPRRGRPSNKSIVEARS